MSDATQLAIDEALKNNWPKAIELNKDIIKENPQDVEALNRLAYAYAETGMVKEAKTTYRKVLQINRFNTIAIKNLQRISLLKDGVVKPTNGALQKPRVGHFASLFLEEVGKTKVVSLIHLAEAKIVTTLHSTDQVLMVPRRRGVAVTTTDNEYIGALPDDIARRLFVLIKGGNEYEAYLKSVDKNGVSVFVREMKRMAKFRNQPSFLGKGTSYYSTVREEVFQDESKPDVSRLEDVEEDLAGGGATDEEDSAGA